MKHSIYPRTIESNDRYTVIRESADDVVLYFDGEFVQYYASAAEATHAGAMMLEEIARDIAAGLVGQAGVLV